MQNTKTRQNVEKPKPSRIKASNFVRVIRNKTYLYSLHYAFSNSLSGARIMFAVSALIENMWRWRLIVLSVSSGRCRESIVA